MTSDPQKLGSAIAASRHNKTFADLNRTAGFVGAVSADETFCRGLCKMAAALYKQDGADKTTNGILFKNLANNATTWKPGYRVFSDAVLNAVGRSGMRMEKFALLPEAMMVPSLIKGTDAVTAPIRMALALGILGGATGGAGAHLLSRSTRQTSEENEELLQKAREYRRLRQEIDEDIHNSGLKEGGQDVRHAL